VTNENAKTVRFGVPTSTDPKIWRQLDPQQNRLTRLMVEKARKDRQKEIEAETRQILFDNQGNANSMSIPYALLRMQVRKADEFAERQFSIFRDVWIRLGGTESAAFFRTISWMVIQRPFGWRASSVVREEIRRQYASGGLRRRIPEETIRKAFDALATEWRNKLEIKALEWEAEAHGRASATASRISKPTTPVSRAKRATRPKPACFKSAVEQVSKNPSLTLVEFCRLMDRKAAQFPNSQKYLPPKNWKARSFFEQYDRRSNTVSRFLSDVRKAKRSGES
jgi:hypothetical protein